MVRFRDMLFNLLKLSGGCKIQDNGTAWFSAYAGLNDRFNSCQCLFETILNIDWGEIVIDNHRSNEGEIPKSIILSSNITTAVKEKINHPSHYNKGKIEVIDFIEDQNLNFHLGNVIKYISRAGKKDDYVQDLEKAKWYINREIERYQKEHVSKE